MNIERIDRQITHQAAAGPVPERIAGDEDRDAQIRLRRAPREQVFQRCGEGRAPGEALFAGERRVRIEEGEVAGAAGDDIRGIERGAGAGAEPGETVLADPDHADRARQ
jgi:hypothetical protein